MNEFHNLNIRRMEIKDYGEVCKLEKEIFPCPWSKSEIWKILSEDKFALSLVAEIQNEIVGYSFIWVVCDEVHIGNFAIKEEYREKKIGTRLLQYIIDEASKLGGMFFYLEVRKSNSPAINLYKKFEFVPLSIRKNYYANNNEDAIVMCKYLNGVLQT